LLYLFTSCRSNRRWQKSLLGLAGLFLLVVFLAARGFSQTTSTEKPVPVLSGTAGFLSDKTAGQTLLDTQFNPVLLVPLGERWLVESRGELEESSSVRPEAVRLMGQLTSTSITCRPITSRILTSQSPWDDSLRLSGFSMNAFTRCGFARCNPIH
jgi:hypothetical protein